MTIRQPSSQIVTTIRARLAEIDERLRLLGATASATNPPPEVEELLGEQRELRRQLRELDPSAADDGPSIVKLSPFDVESESTLPFLLALLGAGIAVALSFASYGYAREESESGFGSTQTYSVFWGILAFACVAFVRGLAALVGEENRSAISVGLGTLAFLAILASAGAMFWAL